MRQPLEFRKHILNWVGGREGVLAEARQVLADEKPQAGIDAARRRAVDAVLDAAKALTRVPLGLHVDAHLAAALDEYEMEEGYRPTGADFEIVQVMALDGEVLAALDDLGPIVVKARLGEKTVGGLVADAICAVPVGDKAKSLAFLGVTTEDVEVLAAERVVSQPLVETLDIWDTNDNDETADPWDDDTAVAQQEERRSPKSDAAGSSPAGGATQRRGKGEPSDQLLPGETPLTTACVAALDVLCRKSSATEQDVGDVIDVSRAMMNKYRYRKTAWVPTPAQVDGIYTLVEQFYMLFADARNDIDGARP